MTARRRSVTTDSGPFALTPLWIVRALPVDQRANGAAVWCLLWDHADRNTMECWPSRRRLAEQLGRSVDTIKRAVAALEQIGAVERLGQRDGHGAQRYHLRTVPPHPTEDHQ